MLLSDGTSYLVFFIQLRQEGQIIIVFCLVWAVPANDLHLIARRRRAINRAVPAVSLCMTVAVMVMMSTCVVQVLMAATLVGQVPGEIRHIAQTVRTPLTNCIV